MYLETAGKSFGGSSIRSFFAHIDDDLNYNRTELRILLDSEAGLNPFVLHLNKSTISESIEAVAAHAGQMMREKALPAEKNLFTIEFKRTAPEGVSPLISFLLYICSATKDMKDSAGSLKQPRNPMPKKVKGGTEIFQPDRPTIWETGYRMGEALARAKTSIGIGESRPHVGPAPHIKRAHWHSFWQGPKSEQGKRSIEVKWLPPMPVGVGDLGDMIPTIRLVK